MGQKEYEQEHPLLLGNWVVGKHVENASTERFFSDGVVYPNIWFSQNIRPLFLLKEAYGDNYKELDIRKWMIKGTGPLKEEPDREKKGLFNQVEFIVFKRILQWSSILFREKRWESPVEACKDRYKWKEPLFRKIAIVNIKKYDGKNQSDEKDLFKHIETHKEQLQKQIELIDPTIVVCGGTMSFFQKIFDNQTFEPIGEVIQNGKKVYAVRLNDHVLYVIDFWHPAYHFKKEEFFCKKIQEARNEIDKARNNTSF